ncbi:hypothetical protein [Paenibacillus macerans]|uniref:hypothetical protein n=1 Tax=Paenibacillus macerans TaxID=44252 RepID=UPI00203A4EAE|nr:hypothetical protein [Paenibacillus macerans]MCM3701375.1 hypothetical protein [Paenibacillus macerans]
MSEIGQIAKLRNTSKISESMETCKKQMTMVDFYRKLAEAEKQVTDGLSLVDGERVFQRLSDKYGN